VPHQGISRRARLQLRSSRLRLPSVNHAATQRSSGAVWHFQRRTGAGDPRRDWQRYNSRSEVRLWLRRACTVAKQQPLRSEPLPLLRTGMDECGRIAHPRPARPPGKGGP